MNSNKTILLVEDDPLISRMYERRISAEGMTVILASNGLVGLEKLQQNKIDLILLDMMMPQMNGYEMLREVRINPVYKAYKDIPIVILTNLQDRPEEIEKVKQVGVQDYLIKSAVSMKDLIEKINLYVKNNS